MNNVLTRGNARTRWANAGSFVKKQLAVLSMAAAPVAAFAQDASFDETSIITKITTYGGKAVLIIGAFLLAVWGLRALGILGKR